SDVCSSDLERQDAALSAAFGGLGGLSQRGGLVRFEGEGRDTVDGNGRDGQGSGRVRGHRLSVAGNLSEPIMEFFARLHHERLQWAKGDVRGAVPRKLHLVEDGFSLDG